MQDTDIDESFPELLPVGEGSACSVLAERKCANSRSPFIVAASLRLTWDFKWLTETSIVALPVLFEVRIAQLEDAERITSVINSAFRRAEEFFIDGDRIDVESVRNFLNTGNFLLAEREDVLVGCVYVEPRGNRAYLGLLAVDPAGQNFGLGSLLMDAAEDYCRELSCRFMDIYVVNLREDLPGFYRRRGYVETGTSPFPSDLKTKLPVHFIEMSKPLGEDKEVKR